MSKTVKLMTVVDGQDRSVGRCHPGQARLLQKQGLADWRDGKLWFHKAPENLAEQREPDDVAREWKLFTEPYADRYASDENEGIYYKSVKELVNPYTARALDTMTAASRIRYKPSVPRTVIYDNVVEWLDAVEARRVKGHDLTVYALPGTTDPHKPHELVKASAIGVSNGYVAVEIKQETIEAVTDEDLASVPFSAEHFKKAMTDRWSMVRLLLRGDREEFLDGLDLAYRSGSDASHTIAAEMLKEAEATIQPAEGESEATTAMLRGLEATIKAAQDDGGRLPVPEGIYMPPTYAEGVSIRSLGKRTWDPEAGQHVVKTTGGVRPEQTMPAGPARFPRRFATEDGREFQKPKFRKPEHPGWASFNWPADFKRIPVVDAEGNSTPRGMAKGFYRRLRGRLYRFWTDAKGVAHYDESEIGEAGRYVVVTSPSPDAEVGDLPHAGTVLRGGALDAKAEAERLYELHTDREDPTEIYVNGKRVQVVGKHLDYAQVIALAGYSEGCIISVTYGRSPDGDGVLIPGKFVRIGLGTVFNAMDTSSA